MLKKKDWLKDRSVVFFAGFSLLAVILLVGLLKVSIFNPDYIEFGPWVSLYPNIDCAKINNSNTSNDCLLVGSTVSSSRTNPKRLDQALSEILKSSAYGDTLKIYPKRPEDWQCSHGGNIILNNSEEKAKTHAPYKCWPKI